MRGGTIGANISFKYSEIRSVEELELYLTGSYSNSIAGIKAGLDMKSSSKRESFYYMLEFTQNMFSLDVE